MRPLPQTGPLTLFLVFALSAGHVRAQNVIWEGYVNTNWDFSTTNWSYEGMRVSLNDLSLPESVQFDDTAFNPAETNINLIISHASPTAVVVTNNALNYTIGGPDQMVGAMQLTKSGSASLRLADRAIDQFTGGVVVNGGTLIFATGNEISGGVAISAAATVQVGQGATNGNLPSGNVDLEGTLVFDRGGGALEVANNISGTNTSGWLRKIDAGSVLSVYGFNSFAANVEVVAGTLQTGSSNALGNTQGTTTVDNGASLDVGGQDLGSEMVTISGSGAAGNGAIINNGLNSQTHALRLVTLAGPAAIGGNGNRWDIRESSPGAADATLAMNPPGSGFSLTKAGSSYVALVGVIADGSLSEINVEGGTLGIEGGTLLPTSMPFTVSSGATLELFSNTVPLAVTLVLNGNGSSPTILTTAGRPQIDNFVTVNNSPGSVVFSNWVYYGGSVSLTFTGVIQGTGNVVKTGSGQLIFEGTAEYSGTTTNNGGVLMVDGNKFGGAGVDIAPGAVLAGSGYVGDDTVVNGSISPGDPGQWNVALLQIGGNATLNSTSNYFELTDDPSGTNDQLAVDGNLTLNGVNVFQISAVAPLSLGSTYTLVSYLGLATNVDAAHISISPPASGYGIVLVDPASTPGAIEVQVVSPPAPRITGIVASGGKIIIQATNNWGSMSETYRILSSTNLALGLTNWTLVTNGSFNSDGSLAVTNPIIGAAQSFYTIRVP